VANVWRRWGLQPWRTETFKFSTDQVGHAQVLARRCQGGQADLGVISDLRAPRPRPFVQRSDPTLGVAALPLDDRRL